MAILQFLQAQNIPNAEQFAWQFHMCQACSENSVCAFHWTMVSEALQPADVVDVESSSESSDLSRDPAVAALFERSSYSSADSHEEACERCGALQTRLVDHEDGHGWVCVYCHRDIERLGNAHAPAQAQELQELQCALCGVSGLWVFEFHGRLTCGDCFSRMEREPAGAADDDDDDAPAGDDDDADADL